MWKPHLLCFKSILRYPPRKHLLQIARVVSEELYIQRVLSYAPWIPAELDCTYVHIVCLSVAVYSPDVGAVFDRLTSVYKRVLDADASICQIRELGSALFPILENRGPRPVLWLAVERCLRGFVESLVATSFDALCDKGITAVLEGMQYITAFFPSLCSEFYDLDLCVIDEWLRARPALYPTLRSCLLESVRELAEYRPLRLHWTAPCLDHFCVGDAPDLGIPGLGITALLFTTGCRPFPEIGDEPLFRGFLDEFALSVVDRTQQLLRCFAIFLTRAQPDIDYIETFPSLAPILDGCMGADTVSEIVLLSLHILEWLVGQGVADPEILLQMSSLPRIRQELDEMPETARCMLASWIDATLRTLELYLHRVCAEEPVDPPPPRQRRFSDDDFTVYSTDEPLPDSIDQESSPGTALAERIAQLPSYFDFDFDFHFAQ
jgi:hypothetical protein